MKKYKIIFMVVLVAFLTGCSAEYNIVIKENTVNEYFSVQFINKYSATIVM